ncbi:MAG: glycosyltransferase family 39 protein [Anaerolineae bacterium]|nr:glycosyltransferase family 39 protein [Anaerolineae bacterium]
MHRGRNKHNRWGSFLNLIHCALLVVIVAGGAWLRFGHNDWDGGNQLHPDERGILFVAQDIALPDSLVDVFRSWHSSLNPFRTADGSGRLYAYGHLPLYAMVIVERLINVSGLPRFDRLMLAGRAVSALFDTLTILAVWLLGRDLFEIAGREHDTDNLFYRREYREKLKEISAISAVNLEHADGQMSVSERSCGWAGVVGAGLCAVAVLHIQNAHFGTVDTALALFATLSVWLLVRYTRTRQHRWSTLAGVCVGLAAGCKASGVLLVFPVAAAYVTWRTRAGSEGKARRRPGISNQKALWLTAPAAILAFALTNPYALLDPVPFLDSLATQAAMTSGAPDWDFTRQYIGTPPLVYPIEQQARWGLGLPLTLAAYGGLAWAAWRAFRERSRMLAVAVVWAAAALLGGGVQMVKFPRYLLPLTPTLFALAGGMLTIPLKSAAKEHRAMAWLRGACIMVIVAPTVLYALAFEGMYRQPHPWVAASRWSYQSMPPGTRVAVEQDDALPLDITLDGQLRLGEKHVETCTLTPFAEPDDETKLNEHLRCLAGAEYLIVASSRHYGVIPRLDERYPLTAAYYRALFGGELGFELTRTFERPPTLLGWSLVDDPFRRAGLPNPLGGWGDRAINLGLADEAFTLYDHPLVLVFRNQGRFSAERMRDVVEAGVESRTE